VFLWQTPGAKCYLLANFCGLCNFSSLFLSATNFCLSIKRLTTRLVLHLCVADVDVDVDVDVDMDVDVVAPSLVAGEHKWPTVN